MANQTIKSNLPVPTQLFELVICAGCAIPAHLACVIDSHSNSQKQIFYEVEVVKQNALFPGMSPVVKTFRFFMCALCHYRARVLSKKTKKIQEQTIRCKLCNLKHQNDALMVKAEGYEDEFEHLLCRNIHNLQITFDPKHVKTKRGSTIYDELNN